jgi:hypothetical protein
MALNKINFNLVIFLTVTTASLSVTSAFAGVVPSSGIELRPEVCSVVENYIQSQLKIEADKATEARKKLEQSEEVQGWVAIAKQLSQDLTKVRDKIRAKYGAQMSMLQLASANGSDIPQVRSTLNAEIKAQLSKFVKNFKTCLPQQEMDFETNSCDNDDDTSSPVITVNNFNGDMPNPDQPKMLDSYLELFIGSVCPMKKSGDCVFTSGSADDDKYFSPQFFLNGANSISVAASGQKVRTPIVPFVQDSAETAELNNLKAVVLPQLGCKTQETQVVADDANKAAVAVVTVASVPATTEEAPAVAVAAPAVQ